MLQLHDKGAEVAQLQRDLAGHGYRLADDGLFGPLTDTAVRRFQRANGLIGDGIVGPKTRQALSGEFDDVRNLTQDNIEMAAERLGVDVPAVLALIEVESNGEGFLASMPPKPVILYERHIMYRRLKAAGIDADEFEAKKPNIVNARYGGYQGGLREHIRLAKAKQIDAALAVESASWGLFQIMGFHWERLGYPSAADFEQAMGESEAHQLDAFVRFVNADPVLLAALQRQDWPKVAELYNGPAYARNAYDRRLAEAYDRHGAAYESTV